jgi:N-acetylglucosaminyldiphosphoundecaprenol N-acetyl-beta-D-mannosaminyltransferase
MLERRPDPSWSASLGKRAFLGLDFDVLSHDAWRALLADAAGTVPYQYIVTPNVDHVVCFHEGVVPADVYLGAGYMVCDSRILAKLAALKGIALDPYPGSDMVRDFLADPRSRTMRVGLFGPSAQDFSALKAVYPDHDLLWIEAPMMKPGTAEWATAITRLVDAPFDLLLCCISFPKQEMI